MPTDDLPRVTLQSTHGGTYYWVLRFRNGDVFAALNKSPKEQCEAIAKALAEAELDGALFEESRRIDRSEAT